MSAVTPALRARRPRRHAAWCVAVVCLAAQVLGWLHLIAVEHARCAEHGEAIHVGERAAAPVLHADERSTAMADAALADPHADDHCSWLAERRDLTLGVAPRTVDVPAAARACPPAPAPAPPAASGALYRLAPKQSPPTWS